MIDHDANVARLGIDSRNKPPKSAKLILKYDCCGLETSGTKSYHNRLVRKSGGYYCRKCVAERDKLQNAERARELWKNPQYRAVQEARTHTDELKKSARERTLALWQDEEFRRKYTNGITSPEFLVANAAHLDRIRATSVAVNSEKLKRNWANVDYRRKMSEQSANLWQSDSYRQSVVSALKTLYADPEIRASISDKVDWTPERRAKLSASMKRVWANADTKDKYAAARAARGDSSSLEDIVADAMDAYGVRYVRQHTIGPWVFDFYVPDSELLIEVNGMYWHSKRVGLDKAKATYVARHTKCKLQIITEADLLAEHKLAHLIGRTAPVNSVDFKSLQFKQCLKSDVDHLFAAFHYLGKPTRGGRYFAVDLHGVPIAAIIASPSHRLEVAKSLGVNHDKLIEIARLVIHPAYQVKNLGSWTVSRLTRWAHGKYEAVVAFADTGLHAGTIYKAAGYKDCGVSRTKDYEYKDADGFRLHKKTVWDASKKNAMTEADYAIANKLSKVDVAPKRKFSYLLNLDMWDSIN